MRDVFDDYEDMLQEKGKIVEKIGNGRLRELAAAEREGCEYFGEDIDGGGLWKCTHCDAEQIIDGGTPFTNGMGYCAGCGRPIRTIRYNKWYYNSEEDCGEREVIETIAAFALAGKEDETNE